MQQQNYQNHIRFYPPHHFFFLPVAFLLTVGSAWLAVRERDDRLIWIALTAGFFMILFLAFMLRQHYALGNQNRIVRLEMRLHYYQLTGNRFDPLEVQLSFGQIAALRFASDEELPALTERALKEGLKADDIKKAIRNWQADDMRL
jgi:hypothetical protein